MNIQEIQERFSRKLTPQVLVVFRPSVGVNERSQRLFRGRLANFFWLPPGSPIWGTGGSPPMSAGALPPEFIYMGLADLLF
jgi:hypothetical protein